MKNKFFRKDAGILFIGFWIISIVDFVTTKIGLTLGFYEKNEVANWFIQNNIHILHLVFSGIILYLLAFGLMVFIDWMEEISNNKSNRGLWILLIWLIYLFFYKVTIITNINLIQNAT